MAVLEAGRDFNLRAPGETDVGFIKSTWLRDFQEHSQFARKIATADYAQFHRLLVDRILSRARALVAFDVADPRVLWGHVVWEPGILHYLFVKRPFRNARLGTALYEAAGCPDVFTHLTFAGESVWRTKVPGLRFVPYAV